MFGAISTKVDDAKEQFRNAPLLSLARFLILLGLASAAIVVIADVIMSWGRISTMSSQFTGAMAEAYTGSAAYVFCGVCEAAGLIIAVVYFFQERKSMMYRSIKPTVILALIALAVTLVGAPLLLGFVENILLIIAAIVLCVIGFFFLSVMLSGDGESASPDASSGSDKAKGAPAKEKFTGTTYRVDPKKLAVYNMSRYKHFDICEGKWYVEVGTGLHGKDNVRPLCSVNEYRKGKVRFVNTHNGKEVRP